MFGYETWVTLNGIFIPCTTADTDLDRARIDSSGIYGGSIQGNTCPIGQAHYYDWPTVTANFNAETSPEFLEILKAMIFARNTPVSLIINDGLTGTQRIDAAWWNSISIQASEDSLVTASVSFAALERNAFDVNEFTAYWHNDNGSFANNCSNFVPLRNFGHFPLPFWKTKIQEFTYVKSWTLNLTQDVTRFMGCMDYASDIPKNPYILGVGIMNGTMSFNCFEDLNSEITAMPTKYHGPVLNTRQALTLMIDDAVFLTLDGELNKVNDPLIGFGALADIAYEYQIYAFS